MTNQTCLLVYVLARLTTPKFSLWNSNTSCVNDLVNISTNWSLDLEGFKWTSPLLTSYLIKWYLVSICFLFWWNTLFLDSEIAEVLSQYIIVDPYCLCLSPLNTLLNHTAWHAIDVAATYSTSADKSVTMGFFFRFPWNHT